MASSGTDTPGQGPAPRDGFLKRNRLAFMIGGPLVLIAAVATIWYLGRSTEVTDDAYVQAARLPISASIGGRVIELAVKENQVVKRGDLLFRIRSDDYSANVASATARLADAKVRAEALSAAYRQQQLNVAALQTTANYAATEAARQQRLVDAGVASRQDLDRAVNAANEARAQLAVARQQAAVALANLGGRPDSAQSYPAVMQAQAELQRARISLDDTTVRAPVDGVVTRVEQLQLGSYINPAQPLFWLVSGTPWVEANFKEDQLADMRIGQPVAIRIDAFGKTKFPGRVASFSPGTGAAFSPLPAQNATGNWVKVVQRLPVRIAFDGKPPEMAGRIGLSAHVSVDVSAAEPR